MSNSKYICIWDLETTGFVAPEAKILEIGCMIVPISWKNNEEPKLMHWVLDNKVEIPERITEITGITQEIIDTEGREPKDCIREFLNIVTHAEKNITHNGVRFDIPFLVETVKDVLGEEVNTELLYQTLKSTCFDTAVHYKAQKIGAVQGEGEHFYNFAERVMSVRAYGVKFNLGLCCQEEEIEVGEQHRAIADVELTYELYKKINQKEELSWNEEKKD